MTTDKKKMLMTPSYRNLLDSRAITVTLAAFAAALYSAAVVAQNQPVVMHIMDTNTDRIPALTAFPKYPSIARRDRIEGEATVCFKIRANGKISRAVVTERSHRIFSKPALRAIKKSNFEPIGLVA